MRFRLRLLLIITGIIAASTTMHAADHRALALRARAQLLDALANEKAFIKVHAAEALIDLGEKDLPRRTFLSELPAANDVRPYRIGVWRVLAASSPSAAERVEWIARTESVVLDSSAMDRLHAIESLGKLGHVPSGNVRAAAAAMAAGSDAEAVFPRWVLHLAGDQAALPGIVRALDSSDPIARLRAAYVLRWLKINDAAMRAAVARTAGREPSDAIGYAIILGAAVALDADPARTSAWVAALEHILAHGTPGARYDACQTLMRRYTTADLEKLAPLLDHPEGDARIGAAWAIQHVTRRGSSGGDAPQGTRSR
jgi:HEAT repeat protein